MRVGVFVAAAGRRGGGPETYEVEMLRALAALDRENEYFVYCTGKGARTAIGINQPNFHMRVLWPSARWLSISISLPLMMMLDRLDFYHATMVPPPWSPKPFLLTILCSSNWTHPEFYQQRVVWRLNHLLDRNLAKARTLLCISGTLLNDVYDLRGIPKSRMRVTYLGVSREFAPMPLQEARALIKQKYGIEGRFLLFMGQQQERKNVFRVIQAYARFRKRAAATGAGEVPNLALVGRENDPSDAIAAAIQAEGVTSFVQRVRYVAHEDTPFLLTAAEQMVFPSLWEGFGLPVIEAMACDTPVITSSVTCLPEVAGGAAVIVDPESVEEITEAICRIQFDEELRSTLIAKGKVRAAAFTWENCARETLSAYRAMLQPVDASMASTGIEAKA